MKKYRLGAMLLLAALVLALCYTPVAATEIDVAGKSNQAAEWLKQAVPEPGIGDEDVVLALLRGGYVSNTQEYTQGYLRKLVAHVKAGGIHGQSIVLSAKQGLVLLVAGIDIKKNAPELLAYYNDRTAIDIEGPSAQAAVLLLYSAGGQAIQGQLKIDGNELAAALAATRHTESGFGETEPDVLSTALAMQALAAYVAAPGVEDALLYSDMYLQLHTNDIGGFNMEGQPSALATAEVILAVDCQGEDPELLTPDSAPLIDALAVFQNQDGSFSANPDAQPDTQLTAKCLLAFLAKLRYSRSKEAIYNFADVTAAEITEPSASSPLSGGQTGSDAATQGSGQTGQEDENSIPPWMLFGILGLVMLVLILLCIYFASRGKKQNRQAKAGNAKPRKPGSAKPAQRGAGKPPVQKTAAAPPRPAPAKPQAPAAPVAPRQVTSGPVQARKPVTTAAPTKRPASPAQKPAPSKNGGKQDGKYVYKKKN